MKQIRHNCRGFAWSFCEKKLLFAVLLLSGLLLAGCQKRETQLQEGESEYQVYYMNQAVTKLIAQPYRTRTTGTEELIGELMESLTSCSGRSRGTECLIGQSCLPGLPAG